MHKNMNNIMSERDSLKVDLRSIQLDTDREISHVRSSNQSKLDQMAADLRVKTESMDLRQKEKVEEMTRDLKNQIIKL